MQFAVPITLFALLGFGSMVFLAGAPTARLPGELRFEQITDVGARLACAACGATPILMLSVAYAEFAPLPLLLGFVVLPAYAAVALLGYLLRPVGRAVVTGFLAGIVAVLLYDLMRLALSYSQGGGDPIPHIGILLLGDGTPWWVGYLWRTLGNGAGLGIVYGVLMPKKWWGPKSGLGYASCVGLGMILVLWLFPTAQQHLFVLNWQTFVNSCLGHATYGLTLGYFARAYERRRTLRPAPVRGRHART